jgi:hypothetical protein
MQVNFEPKQVLEMPKDWQIQDLYEYTPEEWFIICIPFGKPLPRWVEAKIKPYLKQMKVLEAEQEYGSNSIMAHITGKFSNVGTDMTKFLIGTKKIRVLR